MGADAVDRGVEVHVRPLFALPREGIATRNSCSKLEIDAGTMFRLCSKYWNKMTKYNAKPERFTVHAPPLQPDPLFR
jgi:hypothetical protein